MNEQFYVESLKMFEKGQEEPRLNEDELFEKLRHASKPKSSDNHLIGDMIDKAIKNGNKVYIATDWHLYKKSNNKKGFVESPMFIGICKAVKATVKPNDVLIFLGDLVDGEFSDTRKLKSMMKFKFGYIKNKIILRGNNDLFSDHFYEECGFAKCANSFAWNNILFSHIPQKSSYDKNIHGHLHNRRNYWVPYKNHIDAASYGARTKPIELNSLLKKIPSYAKTITEETSHFNEGYIFEMENGTFFMEDPFYDFLTDTIYD